MADDIQSVGTADRSFATITAWEAATDIPIEATGEGNPVGQCYADSDFVELGFFFGATTDADNFRTLEAAPGQEYDPITNTGVVVRNTAKVIHIAEDYFQLSRMGFFHAGPSTNSCVILASDNSIIFGCYVELADVNILSGIEFLGFTTIARAVSCVVNGIGNRGFFNKDNSPNVEINNCVVNGTFDNGTRGVDIPTNCSVAVSGTAYVGSDSLVTSFSGTATDLWHDPDNNNFFPKAGGVLDGTGTDLSANPDLIQTMQPDVSHGDAGDWNAAPYDGLFAVNPTMFQTNNLGKALLR